MLKDQGLILVVPTCNAFPFSTIHIIIKFRNNLHSLGSMFEVRFNQVIKGACYTTKF
jgi:hypothetical protein